MREKSLYNASRSGQSLVEILIAVAVGTLMIISALTIIAPALRGSSQATRAQVGVALGKELLEGVRVFAAGNWHNIYDLQKGTSSKYMLVMQSSPYAVATGTESISVDSVTAGLVGYWKMDESSGPTTFDFSGSNATGSIAAATATTTCKIGSCLAFNGTSAYVSIPATGGGAALKQQFAAITVSSWINLTAYATGTYGPTIISNTDGDGFGFRINNGYPFPDLRLSVAGYSQILGGSQVPLATWTHVAMTYDGANVKTYINGILQGTAAASGYVKNAGNAASCTFIGADPAGCSPQGAEFYFPGEIDDLRVYSRALSATEIGQIINAPLYSRYFTVENVLRDGSGNITAGAGADDPSTQKITAVYSWPTGTMNSMSMYLTRSKSFILRQTDWSGGGGITGPATSVGSTFATSSNIDFSTTTGSLLIRGI